MSTNTLPSVGTSGSLAHDICVYIGRFQPFHNGHLSVVRAALATASHLIILVGSSHRPRDYFNPWTFAERKRMIVDSITAEFGEDAARRVIVLPLTDYTYNLGQWVTSVQETVREAIQTIAPSVRTPSIALIGHAKDKSSYYLKLFPQWRNVEVPNHGGLSATPIRDAYFNHAHLFDRIVDMVGVGALPQAVIDALAEFSQSAEYARLTEEFDHIRTYKAQFAGLKFPPIFQTVDACVVQSGHVLLIERRSAPGRGLWALPGGFLNADEPIQDAVYRELREETKLRVPEPVLRGSTLMNRRFDDPHRSARGRTITDAFLIHLQPAADLPRVKGMDDAKRAKWWPIADVAREMMFEDHYEIIANLTAVI